MDDRVKKKILSQYQLRDMEAIYLISEDNVHVELLLVPIKRKDDIKELKYTRGDSLIQVKLLGDFYPGGYAGGMTMRNSGTTQALCFKNQSEEHTGDLYIIRTVLEDGSNHQYIHELSWTIRDYSLVSRTIFINNSSECASLEMLSSFSLSEMTPFQNGDGTSLNLHRIRSKWSAEGRLVTEKLEDLQLEPNWVRWQPSSIRFGQVGSMPVKGYFPFMALEDKEANITWGVQLGVESSWQMEIYRRDDGIALSGGLADREFGHWMKTIQPGESFTTPEAILTVCTGDALYACQRLTQYAEKFMEKVPECEQKLPILFNEYCTSWGEPSHEKLEKIAVALRGKGIDYLVIDCGWFLEEGKNWGDGMGDYIPSTKLFPNGLKYTAEMIRNMGMKPGLWFEIDNVGKDAAVYHRDEYLLKRDGYVLTTDNRRFFDMRKKEVWDYLSEKVIVQLKDNHFEYIKMDYNDTIGLGCDDAESIGEGLRQNMEASVGFVKQIKKELPEIIIENCASGGHKLEILMMSLCSMASFSDAHECEEIPVIAANLHRMILPRQSQIWAVIRKDDSLKRIAYTLINTYLGRMCLSGDITDLSSKQWNMIDRGIAFYHKIVPIIKNGFSFIVSKKGDSDRHLTGYQAVIRVLRDDTAFEKGLEMFEGTHDMAFIILHVFHDYTDQVIDIDLPDGCPDNISEIYAGTDIRADVTDRRLCIYPTCEMEAVAILLTSKNNQI